MYKIEVELTEEEMICVGSATACAIIQVKKQDKQNGLSGENPVSTGNQKVLAAIKAKANPKIIEEIQNIEIAISNSMGIEIDELIERTGETATDILEAIEQQSKNVKDLTA